EMSSGGCPRSAHSSSPRPPAPREPRWDAGSRASPPLQQLERGLRDEQGARPDERRDLDLRRCHDLHIAEVAKRLGDGFLALLGYDNHRRLLAPSLDERRGVPGRGGLERVVGEDPERAFVCVGRERGAKRCFPLLAVDLAPEARAYGEGDAAAGPVRGAGRAGARPPGALLAPRLRASARDVAAALDGSP